MTIVKQRADEGAETFVFKITNSNGKHAHFVAMNESIARAIATSERHLHDDKNGICRRLVKTALEAKSPGLAGAFERAKASKLQGMARIEGDFVVLAGEVFTPISEARI